VQTLNHKDLGRQQGACAEGEETCKHESVMTCCDDRLRRVHHAPSLQSLVSTL
jgi:hypothetical protein